LTRIIKIGLVRHRDEKRRKSLTICAATMKNYIETPLAEITASVEVIERNLGKSVETIVVDAQRALSEAGLALWVRARTVERRVDTQWRVRSPRGSGGKSGQWVEIKRNGYGYHKAVLKKYAGEMREDVLLAEDMLRGARELFGRINETQNLIHKIVAEVDREVAYEYDLTMARGKVALSEGDQDPVGKVVEQYGFAQYRLVERAEGLVDEYLRYIKPENAGRSYDHQARLFPIVRRGTSETAFAIQWRKAHPFKKPDGSWGRYFENKPRGNRYKHDKKQLMSNVPKWAHERILLTEDEFARLRRAKPLMRKLGTEVRKVERLAHQFESEVRKWKSI
jgi:hypothetical protein